MSKIITEVFSKYNPLKYVQATQVQRCFHSTSSVLLSGNIKNYGKISAEAYDVWFSQKKYEDTDFFQSYITSNGQPALEVGCGTGRLLLYYKKLGLNVEGLDYSRHMLDICRKNAKEKEINVTLYQQSMQDLNMPKQFRTIFVPWGSFMLVNNKLEANQALKKFHDHLLPKGTLLIPVFNPTKHDIHTPPPNNNEWRLRREGTRERDGALIKCWEKVVFLEKEQLEKAEYRYEVILNNQLIETEIEHLCLRWYSQNEFVEMLGNAGFSNIKVFSGYTSKAANEEDNALTFVARKL